MSITYNIKNYENKSIFENNKQDYVSCILIINKELFFKNSLPLFIKCGKINSKLKGRVMKIYVIFKISEIFVFKLTKTVKFQIKFLP